MTENNFTDDSTHKLNLRHLTLDDYPDLKVLMDLVYPDLGGAWSKKKYRAQMTTFPEGQICIEDHGKVVAAAFH
jgi:hypothetical protein